MDWYPLWNSLRIAAISTVIIFFAGIFAACYIAKLPRLIKGVLDVVLTLPLVLPPTVVGYLLLRVLGQARHRRMGTRDLRRQAGHDLVVAIFATTVVIFPLMYRTVRGAFEAFDETLAYSRSDARALQHPHFLAYSDALLPAGRAGEARYSPSARALGEYGATSMITGYTPGRTATISTTVYQLWQTNNDALAYRWVAVNIVISAVVLLAVNLLERRDFLRDASRARKGEGMSLYVDIEKRLGAFRLRSKFEVADETLALLGASGCGKSVTLKVHRRHHDARPRQDRAQRPRALRQRKRRSTSRRSSAGSAISSSSMPFFPT